MSQHLRLSTGVDCETGRPRCWIGAAIRVVLDGLLLLLSHTPIHPYLPESELKSSFPMDRTRSAMVGFEVCNVFVNEIIVGASTEM
jgi:hypothetical protein